jgi:hypothetical protein
MKNHPQKELQEFSTNFDSDIVRPFFERIQPFFEAGFDREQVEQICELVATLPHNQERTLEFQIRYNGRRTRTRR